MTLKIVRRARQQAFPFPCIDRLRAGSEIDTASQSDLDENDGRSVAHDEIDLPVATTVISRYQPQAAVAEERVSDILALPATLGGDPAAAGHYWTDVRPSVSTRGMPRANRAHVSRRTMVFLSSSESVPVAPSSSAYC